MRIYLAICVISFYCLPLYTVSEVQSKNAPIPSKPGTSHMTLDHGIASQQGNRPYQEDRHDIHITHDSCIYGVYDGHGGAALSEALSHGTPYVTSLAHAVQTEIAYKDLGHICNDWERRILYKTPHMLLAGSTASCVHCDTTNDTARVLNIGDSRTFIVTQYGTMYATTDQTARAEYRRILALGGIISLGDTYITKAEDGNYWDHCPLFPEPIKITPDTADTLIQYTNKTVRCPSLIPSRAFGDYRKDTYGNFYKTPGVTIQPEVHNETLSDIKAIVIATDGIWNTISHPKMYYLVARALGASCTAQETASYIMQNVHTYDNAMVLVVFPKFHSNTK